MSRSYAARFLMMVAKRGGGLRVNAEGTDADANNEHTGQHPCYAYAFDGRAVVAALTAQ